MIARVLSNVVYS